jgi:hypothetical protein
LNPKLYLLNFIKSDNFKFLVKAVKLAFLLALFYLLYKQVSGLNFYLQDLEVLKGLLFKNWYFLLIAIILLSLNYSLEASKWMILTSSFENRNFKTALKDISNGLFIGLFTPFMVGDFVGRSFNFNSKNRASALAANVFNSICQTYTAIFFGTIALILWLYNFKVPYRSFIEIITVLLVFTSFTGFLFLLNFKLSWSFIKSLKLLRFFFGNQVTDLKIDRPARLKVLFLTFGRNMVYNIQFYLVYKFFGLNVEAILAFIGINFLFLIKI